METELDITCYKRIICTETQLYVQLFTISQAGRPMSSFWLGAEFRATFFWWDWSRSPCDHCGSLVTVWEREWEEVWPGAGTDTDWLTLTDGHSQERERERERERELPTPNNSHAVTQTHSVQRNRGNTNISPDQRSLSLINIFLNLILNARKMWFNSKPVVYFKIG